MNADSLYETLLARAEREREPAPRPARARPSAAVVPWRRDAGGALEVYWVRRAPTLRFMGGWWAFPGGQLDRADAGIDVAGMPAGVDAESQHQPAPDLDPGARARLGPDLAPGLLAAAVRELFEETGLLLDPALARAPASTRTALEAARRRLLAGDRGFAAILAAGGWTPSAASLSFAGRWLTPPFAPRRFDNRFFLLEWPAARRLQPSIVPGELVAGEWIAPRAALDRWQAGGVLTAPPILHLLRVLAEDGPERGLPRLHDTAEANLGPLRRIAFAPGVLMLPLATPTLPPATHTNAFLLGDEHGEAVLVDPAGFAAEQDRLQAALEAFQAQGGRVRAIWLSHHHADHIGAVNRLRRFLEVPVAAHPLSTAPLRAAGIRVDQPLADGDLVTLGETTVRVVHTPGHTRGHLAFHVTPGDTLIGGDLVSALSTIVIDPPEGDMDAYLTSLERVAELAPRLLLPSHGPPIARPVERLRWYRRHRLEREAQVLAAWHAGRRSAAAMVAEIYADVPAALHPVAARQIQAHLERLERRGALG